MSKPTAYNSKDWAVNVKSHRVTGFGEEMINASKDEEMFTTSVGAQGDVVVNEHNNDLGTISFTLQATSPSASFLTKIAKSGEIVPVWCNNKNIKQSFGGNHARIKNYAEIVAAQEMDDLTFEFQVFDYTVN